MLAPYLSSSALQLYIWQKGRERLKEGLEREYFGSLSSWWLLDGAWAFLMHMFRWQLALLTYSAIKRSGSGPFSSACLREATQPCFSLHNWRCELCRLQVVYYRMLLHYQTVTQYRSLFLRLSPFIAASRNPNVAQLPKQTASSHRYDLKAAFV